ncbi:NADP-dependent oxidoreductase [Streptomyces sp. NPDC012693]|jgi:NADPH2:quinone reductase|uniref:NADP-dependent oxidoreductase n=1 Tax=unclassified Streptomyces TaxID=2593676 RepID=UPI00202EBD74|nr:NADP-dependent oxidoreductase [Streptomyces sp. MSC1_001]
MKALVSSSYGPVDELELVELPVPAPGPGQVQVKVAAAALNPLDVILITGRLKAVLPVEHPFVPGMDASGVVTAVGEGVTGYAVGDEVVAFTHDTTGTLAEYTLVAEGPGLVRRPENLDAVRAAALPVTSMTASALLEAAELKPGQTVLVVGATGGIGSFLVQLAARAGAEVLATAQAADRDYALGLGARHAIDYTAVDTVEEARRLHPGGVDVAIDLVNGGPAVEATAAAVKDGGRLVSSIGVPETLERAITPVHVGVEGGIGRLEGIVGQVAAGELAVEVSATYPAEQARQAYVDFVAGKHTRGKVVVTF